MSENTALPERCYGHAGESEPHFYGPDQSVHWEFEKIDIELRACMQCGRKEIRIHTLTGWTDWREFKGVKSESDRRD